MHSKTRLHLTNLRYWVIFTFIIKRMKAVCEQLLATIRDTFNQWNDLDIYAQPYPEFPDYGVEEQELLIKHTLLTQLNVIKDYVNCSELINDIKESLDSAVEDYIEKYIDESRSTIENTFQKIGIDTDLIKTTIYCYVSSNDGDLMIGFMDARNHDWDNDCFHKIETVEPFSDAMETILDQIEDKYELDCVNSDNRNYQCYFKGDVDELMNDVMGISLE